MELQELPTKNAVTADKSFTHPNNPARGCNTVRARCIQYVQALEQQGYMRLPLEQAKQVFSQTLGIYDRTSMKAYFGTQAHVCRHTVERFARYQSGVAALKTIELSQRIPHQLGYLETLGLVTYELKGKVWFLVLKKAILVPTLKKKCAVSMPNFSLSHVTEEACHVGCEIERVNMLDTTTNKQQQHRVRERNLIVYETVYKPSLQREPSYFLEAGGEA
jgi:hypothetical protein